MNEMPGSSLFWKEHTVPRLNLYSDERKKYGCVVRAVQSFWKARATDQQWEERLKFIKKTQEQIQKMWKVSEVARAEEGHYSLEYLSMRMERVVYLLEQDTEMIKGWIDKISTSDTPLGEAMRESPAVYRLENWSLTRAMLVSGTNLMVLHAGNPAHMAHLGFDKDSGLFRSYSDSNILLHDDLTLPVKKGDLIQQWIPKIPSQITHVWQHV